ncbi:SUMF1/EgtB/PvdO family nonheme iron enzyme, partial [Candidatus Eisenbacteria bacterium]
ELEVEDTLTVVVEFNPQSAGSQECTIETGGACSEDVSCTGMGELAPVCSVSPKVLTFDPVTVGQSATDSFTITNTGGGTLSGTVSESRSCADFEITSGSGSYELEVEDTLTVVVEFNPQSAGSQDCMIETGGACSEDVSCTGMGELAPVCSVSPIVLLFGSVTVGQSATDSFTITNTGGGMLSGRVSEDGDCEDYSITAGEGDYSLGASEPHLVIVRFAPITAGLKTCAIQTNPDYCSRVGCFGTGEFIAGAYVTVPAGMFIMGDGGALCGRGVHEVTLTRDFYLGQYEVTNREYLEAVQWAYDQGYVTATTSSVQDNLDGSTQELLELDNDFNEIQFDGAGSFYLRQSPSSYAQDAYPDGYDPSEHPVKVNWYGSARYCDWLSLQAGLPRAYEHSGGWSCNGGNPYGAEGYRLPTDAEWEYAAQFDDERLYPWGNESPLHSCNRANFNDHYGGGEYCVGWTSPVGSYPDAPVALGLSDMAGNVQEWCNDGWVWCDLGTAPATDPSWPVSEDRSVARGGCWRSYDDYLRCATRMDIYPYNSYNNVGFRAARTVTNSGAR